MMDLCSWLSKLTTKMLFLNLTLLDSSMPILTSSVLEDSYVFDGLCSSLQSCLCVPTAPKLSFCVTAGFMSFTFSLFEVISLAALLLPVIFE